METEEPVSKLCMTPFLYIRIRIPGERTKLELLFLFVVDMSTGCFGDKMGAVRSLVRPRHAMMMVLLLPAGGNKAHGV